jgi:hypothetical protein
MVGFQTHLDVAQRLAPGKLREGHDAERVGTAKRAYSRIAVVPLDDARESLPRHKLHNLRKQCLAHIHASLPVTESESIANERHAIQIVDTPKSL